MTKISAILVLLATLAGCHGPRWNPQWYENDAETMPESGQHLPTKQPGGPRLVRIAVDTRINGWEWVQTLGWLEEQGVDCLDYDFVDDPEALGWDGGDRGYDVRIIADPDLEPGWAGRATWQPWSGKGRIRVHADTNGRILAHEMVHYLLGDVGHDEDRSSLWFHTAGGGWHVEPDTAERLGEVCGG